MEKIEEKTIEVKRKIHKFYCDRCGEYLGESEEYDDGYYENFGYIAERIVVNGTSYYHRGYLCEKCKKEHFEELGNVLEANGFVKKY